MIFKLPPQFGQCSMSMSKSGASLRMARQALARTTRRHHPAGRNYRSSCSRMALMSSPCREIDAFSNAFTASSASSLY